MELLTASLMLLASGVGAQIIIDTVRGANRKEN